MKTTLLALGTGLFGGLTTFFSELGKRLPDGPTASKTFAVAFISATGGLLAKELYGLVKRKIKSRQS